MFWTMTFKSRSLAVALSYLLLLLSCKSRTGATVSSEIDGNWASACRSKTDQFNTNYFEINTLTFSGNTMTSSIRSFSDPTCKVALTDKPLLTGVSTYSTGDFTIGTGGAKKFNSQLTTLMITLTTDPYVTLYNGSNGKPPVCGGGFVKNQPKEISIANCTMSDSLRSEFLPRFDIFKILGSFLYFGYVGSGYDGSSESKRPLALDPSYYTRI